MQPHPLYPMTQDGFDYWVGVLKTHFSDHPLLSELGKTFYAGTCPAALPGTQSAGYDVCSGCVGSGPARCS